MRQMFSKGQLEKLIKSASALFVDTNYTIPWNTERTIPYANLSEVQKSAIDKIIENSTYPIIIKILIENDEEIAKQYFINSGFTLIEDEDGQVLVLNLTETPSGILLFEINVDDKSIHYKNM